MSTSNGTINTRRSKEKNSKKSNSMKNIARRSNNFKSFSGAKFHLSLAIVEKQMLKCYGGASPHNIPM